MRCGDASAPVPPGEATVEDVDPFDPAVLRVVSDFEAVAVKRVIVSVPVRKPKRQEFVRVHPDERYRLEVAVVELQDGRETYLVVPAPVSTDRTTESSRSASMVGGWCSPAAVLPANNRAKTGDETMLLDELVDAVASDTGEQKTKIDEIVRAVLARIEGAIGKGEPVNLVGFGRFEVYQRGARRGRNLRTGEALQIPATTAVRFKIGKRLRDAAAGSTRKRAGKRGK
jgi:DNA-binding protein HU-beta